MLNNIFEFPKLFVIIYKIQSKQSKIILRDFKLIRFILLYVSNSIVINYDIISRWPTSGYATKWILSGL